jgi:hypothetical protein
MISFINVRRAAVAVETTVARFCGDMKIDILLSISVNS